MFFCYDNDDRDAYMDDVYLDDDDTYMDDDDMWENFYDQDAEDEPCADPWSDPEFLSMLEDAPF